jgi:hypothetical protein
MGNYLCHPTIDYKISCIYKATLIAGEEKHCLSLFNSLTEAASREMNFTAMALGLIVPKPVLE